MQLVDWVLCKVYQNARKVNLNRAGKTQATAAQIFRVPAAAAEGEEFNNGGAVDSRALINQQQFYHQTMLFDQAEFNNNIGSSTSGSMMMVGQEYINPQHYHPNSRQTVFDHNINRALAAAGGGGREEFNNNVYAGCMMEAEDMGTLFNPPNYYNPYLDKTSLFNSYLNHQAAAGGGGSKEFNNGKYSSYVGECSSSSSSNIFNVEAQGFYNGNGSGKAILNNQEDYCPPVADAGS